LQLVNVV